MSNITLNIVEPGSPTPIDPVVPNTGLFTSGIGSTEATIMTVVSAVLILTIVSIVLAVLYKKHKKQGRTTKLVHIIDSCKTITKSKKRITAGLSAIALLASAGTFATLLSTANKNNTNAAEAEDGLTLDVSGGDITIELADEPVFAIAEVKATVAEETPAGYTLTAYADSTDLVSTTDSSKVIPMVTVDEAELVALTDNTYGLSLLEPDSETDEVYTALSTDSLNPTIIRSMPEYTPTEENDATTIYYGFYITPDVPYGTYEGSNINYMANPNYITTLSFNGNGSDGGTLMEDVTIPAGETIALPQNTFTREGYHFTGWNTDPEGEGRAYADEAEYTADSGQSKNVTLYAQWEEDGPTISDLTYMQDFATLTEEDKASVLNSMTQEQQYQLEDNRDQKVYYISRLKDDNIWMTQNLDFNIVNGGTGLDYTNTDVPANWADAGNLTNTYTTDDATWNNSKTTPESYDPGNRYWNGELNENWDGTLDNMTTESGNSHYHIGNYYNWTAAVAMSDSSSYETDGTDVDQSICPAGWRLPSGGPETGNKSFQYLISQYGWTDITLTLDDDQKMWEAPLYSVLGGVWYGSSGSVGSSGGYWSSVVLDSDNSYQPGFSYDGKVFPGNFNDRSNGSPVRCVAE